MVDAAVRVHRELGPGLLESVYEAYLRLSGNRLGFLLNLGEVLMKDWITRLVNNLQEDV